MSDGQACVRFRAFGGPEVLEEVWSEPIPVPGPGEVRVRVEASSVQFTDTLIRRGLYPELRDRPPLVPGYDLVGRVDQLGPGVEGWAVGDRVADLCVLGGNARYALRPAAGLVRVPATVDAAEAATLVLSWVTAHQVLHRMADLEAGQRALVLGGNGAVGQAFVALAVLAGVEVYATARERFHGALRAAGAHPLPRDGWAEEVRAVGGIDLVLDGVAADGFRSSLSVLGPGGRLVAIGGSAVVARGQGLIVGLLPGLVRMAAFHIWPNGKAARFYSIGAYRNRHPEHFREDLGALFDLLAEGRVTPSVAERLRFDQVTEAHARLERGGLRGKLVLEPWRPSPSA